MNPIFLDLGFITIRYYGLFYVIGLFLSIYLMQREIKRVKLDMSFDYLTHYAVRGFLFSLIFSRLYFVVFNWEWYFGPHAKWYEFLAFWKGGLAIHGGIIGSILFFIWLSKQDHCGVKTAGLFDYGLFFIYLGQVLGRFGNFMNGDAHGLPTGLPWGIVFKYGPASFEFPGIPLHPVMLYEASLNSIALFFVWKMRLKNFKAGFMAATASIFAALNRSFASLFRADDLYVFIKTSYGTNKWFTQYDLNSFAWGVKAPHAIAVIIISLSVFFIFKYKLYQISDNRYQYNKTGRPSPLWK